jgi:hypothetical protein
MKTLILEAAESEPTVTLLDARAGEGPAARPFMKMSWTGNLASLYVPLLNSESELRRRWASVPARAGHRVVVAARHWREAAHTYFMAKLLGYSVRIADASIEDLERSVAPLERGP